MARNDPFPPEALAQLAADAADWLAASDLPTENVTLSSAPLRVWNLDTGDSLREATIASDEYHHQILHAGAAIAFARSRVVQQQAELIELAESPLAQQLDEVLRELARQDQQPDVLRLLQLPSNHTTCLWLHDTEHGDELIPLQSPLWPLRQRVDERTFFRMVHALRGPGIINNPKIGQRRESADPWGGREHWNVAKTRPVRQLIGEA